MHTEASRWLDMAWWRPATKEGGRRGRSSMGDGYGGGEAPRGGGEAVSFSCEAEKAVREAGDDTVVRKWWLRRTLTGGEEEAGVGEESEWKRRRKRVQDVRDITREMMDGLNTRNRESIGRNLKRGGRRPWCSMVLVSLL